MRQPSLTFAMNVRKNPRPVVQTVLGVKQWSKGLIAPRRKGRLGPGERRIFAGNGQICGSTATVTDKHTGKVVGKPYWGKLDVRFDEGAGGN